MVATIGDGDGGAKAHDEGRRDADPEQPLRQREHQHDDGARAGPQTDGDNGGKAAAEPMRALELLRLRRMGMAPGRGFFLAVVMIVIMAVRVIVVIMVVIDDAHERGRDHAHAMIVMFVPLAAQQPQKERPFTHNSRTPIATMSA